MDDLENWTKRAEPRPSRLSGRLATLSSYRQEDAGALWDAFGGAAFNDLARYFPNPRYESVEPFAAWLDDAQRDWHTLVYRRNDTDAVCGMASYMRIDAANGSCEVGSICHAPSVQRSPLTTEAQYLMARHVFEDLGYRRYEWKLNNENAPSHAAAKRFGFSFEGVFRQHIVAKGKNRDTAWYAMIDKEWPLIRDAFDRWLDPRNFDAHGMQKFPLAAMNAHEMVCGSVLLRRAEVRSGGDIAAFQKRAYERTAHVLGSTPIPLAWDYAAILRECEVWVAGPQSEPDGVLILRRAGDLVLESIATSPEKSGTGLGRILMDAAFERARALGLPAVRLVTNARNPAVAWYRRLGFRPEREAADGERVIVHMTKAM